MKKYSKFLSLVLALAIIVPGFAQVVQADPIVEEVKLERLAGADRVETAIKISRKAYNKADTVVLAGYNGEADALTGTLLAEEKNAPVLLTYKDMLDVDLVAEINRLGAKNVYILGGDTVVFPSVETDLKTAGFNTTRLKGDTRVETAIAIANQVFGSVTPAEAFAVGYNSLADALAIGPVAANKKAPILITYKDNVPAKTEEAMKSMKIKDLTVIGKELAVSEEGLKALQTITGKAVERVGGSNREFTSLEIANKYFETPEAVVVANGYRYADALVGGYFAANMEAPIVLTNTTKITPEVLAFIKEAHVDTYVLGGLAAVDADVYAQIAEQLKVTPVDPQIQILADAKTAVEEYENKLATKDQIIELVNNDELRNEVSALKTSAFNKVQLVKGEEKDALLARLDLAHDKLIAATAVKGLQNSTKDLTVANLENAKIKLSNAKTNVKRIADGDIKTALNALIKIEEDKIVALEESIKEDGATLESVNALIEALPVADTLNVNNWEEYLDQIVDTRAAYESLTAEQQAKLKPANQVKYDEVMAKAEIVEEEYILGLDN